MSEIEKKEINTSENGSENDSENGFSGEFEIKNKLGFHARAAVLFVKAAGKFESKITISKDDIEVNGKSIMGILMLGAAMGTTITVVAKGSDAERAVRELGNLILSKFGEEK